jgi:hypothetical protein
VSTVATAQEQEHSGDQRDDTENSGNDRDGAAEERDLILAVLGLLDLVFDRVLVERDRSRAGVKALGVASSGLWDLLEGTSNLHRVTKLIRSRITWKGKPKGVTVPYAKR